MFIVCSGKLKCEVNGAEVRQLGVGDSFGDVAVFAYRTWVLHREHAELLGNSSALESLCVLTQSALTPLRTLPCIHQSTLGFFLRPTVAPHAPTPFSAAAHCGGCVRCPPCRRERPSCHPCCSQTARGPQAHADRRRRLRGAERPPRAHRAGAAASPRAVSSTGTIQRIPLCEGADQGVLQLTAPRHASASPRPFNARTASPRLFKSRMRAGACPAPARSAVSAARAPLHASAPWRCVCVVSGRRCLSPPPPPPHTRTRRSRTRGVRAHGDGRIWARPSRRASGSSCIMLYNIVYCIVLHCMVFNYILLYNIL